MVCLCVVVCVSCAADVCGVWWWTGCIVQCFPGQQSGPRWQAGYVAPASPHGPLHKLRGTDSTLPSSFFCHPGIRCIHSPTAFAPSPHLAQDS